MQYTHRVRAMDGAHQPGVNTTGCVREVGGPTKTRLNLHGADLNSY